jgi:hypothetical protein
MLPLKPARWAFVRAVRLEHSSRPLLAAITGVLLAFSPLRASASCGDYVLMLAHSTHSGAGELPPGGPSTESADGLSQDALRRQPLFDFARWTAPQNSLPRQPRPAVPPCQGPSCRRRPAAPPGGLPQGPTSQLDQWACWLAPSYDRHTLSRSTFRPAHLLISSGCRWLLERPPRRAD